MSAEAENIEHNVHSQDDEHEHQDHAHYHAKMKPFALVFGGALILASFLAEAFYDEPALAILSARLGSVLLSIPIVIDAAKHIAKGKIHMDSLVGIALIAAIVMQKYQEAGIIAFFMLIAIALEERTAHGAQKSIKGIISLTPNIARLLKGNDEIDVKLSELNIGDVVRVRPGENFPADGQIIKGTSTVNQASITGESLPIDKSEKDDVYAGTENLTGAIDLKVTGIGKDTTLGKVKDLIQAAEKSRPPILRMIDQYVVYYTPTILMIALITWFATNDLMQFVYVLVIACPCALVIATPSAVVAAIASAARLGMLIKDVATIEAAAKIKAVVFDKTGTLTEGKLEVSKLNPLEGVDLTDLLTSAVSTESQSNHPAAHAMRKLAEKANVKILENGSFEEVAGKGVIAKFDGITYRVGRGTWLEEEGLNVKALIDDFQSNEEMVGMSVVYVAKDKQMLGWIGLRDAIREEASKAIEELNDLGINNTSMVTGDNDAVAQSVGRKVGIREISADCLPEDKVKHVEKLKAEGYITAVVGDGVNDAPALATGDISIAMGAIGSDVAINSASIALMNNDLRRIPFLIDLSRKTRNVINLNLFFGCVMIVGGILLFIFGNSVFEVLSAKWGADPDIIKSIVAVMIHNVGTLIVIFNSARLVRFGEYLENIEK